MLAIVHSGVAPPPRASALDADACSLYKGTSLRLRHASEYWKKDFFDMNYTPGRVSVLDGPYAVCFVCDRAVLMSRELNRTVPVPVFRSFRE